MTGCDVPPPLPDALAAALRGEPVTWRGAGLSASEVLDGCAAHETTALLHQRLRERTTYEDWPEQLRDDIGARAHADAARELARRREIVSALDALHDAGVRPVLLKGTPLAYSLYPMPSARPRSDTDLIVRRADADLVRDVLAAHGYAPTVYCEGELLFCQFEVQKRDRFGLTHAFDIHWKISTQALFADLLGYRELADAAVPVPALGPHARAAGALHALLLACVHPAMHHRNERTALWTYDIHLLVTSMTEPELGAFTRQAIDKRVAAIVCASLDAARAIWRTPIPDDVLIRLRACAGEPSAAYLTRGRRWHNELATNLRSLAGWRSRWRLLREIAFPSAAYMYRAYRIHARGLASVLLPLLYVHRLGRGAARVVLGRK